MSNRKDSLELLSTDLLEETKWRGLLEYWRGCLGRELGWHYPLDLIWIIKKLRESGIKKGSAILDAGAGTGLSQFLLSSLGYNVLSVDYGFRRFPFFYRLIFSLKDKSGKRLFESSYIEHAASSVGSGRGSLNLLLNKWRSLSRINFAVLLKEVISSRKNKYGIITLYREDFRDMRFIPTESVDCVVSVSALEHNDPKGIGDVVSEFSRILKVGAPMFLTTSATDSADWFHEPSHGWCFSERTLTRLFSLKNPDSNFGKYGKLFSDLKQSKYLKENLSSYYFKSGQGGMPWGKWKPLYHPVGVVKYKQ